MAEINLGAIRFNWKGAYAGGTAYVVDDVVSYLGSSYVCILASTGNVPTNGTYWNLMAQGGTGASSTLTTQGDILYRNASGLARLGAGTSGQALLTGGTGANPSWGEAGGGKLLQVVTAVHSTAATQGDATFVNTGLTAAITPSATSSKILITSVVNAYMADYVGGISLYKNGSQVVNHSGSIGSRINVNSSSRISDSNVLTNITLNYLDSPSSTSALTYQIYLYTRSSTYYVNRSSNDGDNNDHARTISTITAMEVAG